MPPRHKAHQAHQVGSLACFENFFWHSKHIYIHTGIGRENNGIYMYIYIYYIYITFSICPPPWDMWGRDLRPSTGIFGSGKRKAGIQHRKKRAVCPWKPQPSLYFIYLPFLINDLWTLRNFNFSLVFGD